MKINKESTVSRVVGNSNFKSSRSLSFIKNVKTPQLSIQLIQEAKSQEDALASQAFKIQNSKEDIQNLKFKRRLHLTRKLRATLHPIFKCRTPYICLSSPFGAGLSLSLSIQIRRTLTPRPTAGHFSFFHSFLFEFCFSHEWLKPFFLVEDWLIL